VDIGNLEKAITKAKSLKKADYTIESWNAMEAVLKVAEKVMADQGATQDEIDDAADALDKAIKALALPTGKNSETGNNTFVVMVAVIGAVALAGIVVLLVYKQKNRR
jgi:ABC-type transporter Mla subunit MlaD